MFTFVCYNIHMKNLYYATFERGVAPVIKNIIKKIDKTAIIKKIYDDAVIFVAGEIFKSCYDPFKTIYQVLDSVKKTGMGAINVQLKHFLERKDLKIYFPKEVFSFKLEYKNESQVAKPDDALRRAVETRLKQLTKRSISFNSQNAELVFLTKSDGECLFMKKIFKNAEMAIFDEKNSYSSDVIYTLCHLSEPATNETILDPFADKGRVSYIRSLCFKKAKVIANEKNSEFLPELKKKAKRLKEKQFSVLNYDFLDEKFPIHFIDKVISIIPSFDADGYFSSNNFYKEFFNKLYGLKVKVIALMLPKYETIDSFISEKFEIETTLSLSKCNLIKLKYRG